MANSAAGTPLGAFGRAFSAMRNRLYSPTGNLTVNGVTTQAWPSPLEPVQPIGPAGSKPLAFSFYQGVNQNITPRLDAELTYAALRDLATYPLAWICRENVKDVICGMSWKVQLKRIPGESTKDWKTRQAKDKVSVSLTEFFKCPDGESPWSDWLRPILEDMLVIDAASILVDRALSGKVLKLRWTDGADILRIVDDQGYLPDGDGWAYTQLWEGIPRIALSRRQLVYRPSNIVAANTLASKLYGSSITQQLAPEIKIGQERLKFVLAYYTEGAVPGLVHVVKPGVNPDKITEAMNWQNSVLAGNLAARRQWRMIQGFNSDGEDQIEQLKEPVLADVFDDLHIRKVCFGYGTSAQRLLKQMNRAAAEAGQDASEKEGTMPRLRWVKSTMDHIIAVQFDQPNHEWLPETDDELDAAKQAEVDKTLISTGQETIDERREARGLIPFGLPETSQPIIITATGVVPVEGSIERTQQAHTAAMAPPPAPVIQGGNQNSPTKPVGPKKKLTKSAELTIDPERDTGVIRQAKDGMRVKVAFWLQRQGKKASLVETTKVAKAADDPKDIDEIVDAIMAEITWSELVDIVEPDLSAAYIEGGTVGLKEVEAIAPNGVEISTLINEVNSVAGGWAKDRAAELVGMKWVDDELVANPNAQYAITDTTRTMLRRTIAEAFDAETTMGALQEAIQTAGAFSPERAELIARTEVSMAQTAGNYAGWVKNGNVEATRWQVSADHEICDECDANEDAGPVKLGEEFPSGDLYTPAHPRCECVLIATKIKGVKL